MRASSLASSARPTKPRMLAARFARRTLLPPGARRAERHIRRSPSDRCDAGRPARFRCTVSSPNNCTFWKVRAMPRAAMSGDFSPTMSAPSKRDAARGRRVDAGQHVHHRALARTVRPDQAVDRAGLHREVDAVQRLQAAELHDDLLHVEQRPLRGRAFGGVAAQICAASPSVSMTSCALHPFRARPGDELLQEADDAVRQVDRPRTGSSCRTRSACSP